MPILSSTILSLHYATNHENLWLCHIGATQTQIQLPPFPYKAPSRPQSYSHLLHILAHQCLLFLTLIAPIYSIIQILPPNLSLNILLLFFTRSFHFNHVPSCLVMQKNFVAYFIAASCHNKKYHFCLQTNQPLQYMLRISHTSHQNHHIILARTNHHRFLALYFYAILPG